MGKQALEKCLTNEPESEGVNNTQSATPPSTNSQQFLLTSCILRADGRQNEPP